MAEFYRKKKKICQMCAGKSVESESLSVTEGSQGRILEAKADAETTGECCLLACSPLNPRPPAKH